MNSQKLQRSLVGKQEPDHMQSQCLQMPGQGSVPGDEVQGSGCKGADPRTALCSWQGPQLPLLHPGAHTGTAFWKEVSVHCWGACLLGSSPWSPSSLSGASSSPRRTPQSACTKAPDNSSVAPHLTHAQPQPGPMGQHHTALSEHPWLEQRNHEKSQCCAAPLPRKAQECPGRTQLQLPEPSEKSTRGSFGRSWSWGQLLGEEGKLEGGDSAGDTVVMTLLYSIRKEPQPSGSFGKKLLHQGTDAARRAILTSFLT